MRVRILFLVLLLSFVTVNAQEDFETPFQLHSDDPVVTHGRGRDWDNPYTDPGAVVYHDGQFHMFRNGFRGWVASVQIGYLTSPDGLTWTEMSEEPVLTTDEVPFAGEAALASSAVVLDDGTWVLYFYTWQESNGAKSPGVIGRATAENPLGPWTVDPEPVLTPGGEGSWDSFQVSAPKVIRTEEGFRMYYAGNSEGLFDNKIGLAVSEDGITWEKYDDPVFREGSVAVSQANVFQTPEGWVMLYRYVPPDRQMAIGYALSDDGISWQSGEPVWQRDTIPRSNGFWFVDAVYHDGTYYLYIEGGRGGGTDIYVATYEGMLGG